MTVFRKARLSSDHASGPTRTAENVAIARPISRTPIAVNPNDELMMARCTARRKATTRIYDPEIRSRPPDDLEPAVYENEALCGHESAGVVGHISRPEQGVHELVRAEPQKNERHADAHDCRSRLNDSLNWRSFILFFSSQDRRYRMWRAWPQADALRRAEH